MINILEGNHWRLILEIVLHQKINYSLQENQLLLTSLSLIKSRNWTFIVKLNLKWRKYWKINFYRRLCKQKWICNKTKAWYRTVQYHLLKFWSLVMIHRIILFWVCSYKKYWINQGALNKLNLIMGNGIKRKDRNNLFEIINHYKYIYIYLI